MPEKPLRLDDSLVQFAENFRQLRHHAGISYRSRAERVDISPSVLSQAASGRKLPIWNVTRAFVKSCSGDETVWYEQWSQVQRELNAHQTSTTTGQVPTPAPVGKALEGDPHSTTEPNRQQLDISIAAMSAPDVTFTEVVLPTSRQDDGHATHAGFSPGSSTPYCKPGLRPVSQHMRSLRWTDLYIIPD